MEEILPPAAVCSFTKNIVHDLVHTVEWNEDRMELGLSGRAKNLVVQGEDE